MLPQRVTRLVSEDDPPPTTQLVGFGHGSVASGAQVFQVSDRIPGVIDILEVFWSMPATGTPALAHEFQFAVGESAPADQAAMNALPQVFPTANMQSAIARGSIWISANESQGRWQGRFRVTMNGERLISRFENGSTATVSAYIGIIFEGLDFLPAGVDDSRSVSRTAGRTEEPRSVR